MGSIHRVRSPTLPLLWYRIRLLWYWIGLCWFWVKLAWYWIRAAFFWWLFLILLWDFTDLLGIPLIQDLKAQIHEAVSAPAKLFVKEDPARIREKALAEAGRIEIEAIQARCRHITRRNGLWNYFCPLCGKKLIPGDHPWWQI